MGVFSWIKNIFRKKEPELEGPLPPAPMPREEIQPSPDLTPEPLPPPPEMPEPIMREPLARTESIDVTNIKVKVDLLLAEVDHLKTQNQIITEQLKKIERMLAEAKGIRYY